MKVQVSDLILTNGVKETRLSTRFEGAYEHVFVLPDGTEVIHLSTKPQVSEIHSVQARFPDYNQFLEGSYPEVVVDSVATAFENFVNNTTLPSNGFYFRGTPQGEIQLFFGKTYDDLNVARDIASSLVQIGFVPKYNKAMKIDLNAPKVSAKDRLRELKALI